MEEVKYLRQIFEDLEELAEEISLMGLMSVKDNMLQELTVHIKNCELCGLMFPANILKKILSGIEKSHHTMEYDFSDEAEELLLLGNWLLFFKREIEIEDVKSGLTRMKDVL